MTNEYDDESAECCTRHVPDGFCCDPDTCDPCCGACPTCPTLHRDRSAGTLRRRSERGSGDPGLVGSLIIVILLLAVIRVVFEVDLLGYVAAAVDWVVEVLGRLADGSTRH